MAYKCPRCDGKVSRNYSENAQRTAGLVGLFFAAAFGAFNCEKCGKIPRKEFPSDVQMKMAAGTLLLAVLAIGIIFGLIVLIST